MAKIEKSELTSEMIAVAMQCKTADELLELAKSGGYEITKAEAEAYLAELAETDRITEKYRFCAVSDSAAVEFRGCFVLDVC